MVLFVNNYSYTTMYLMQGINRTLLSWLRLWDGVVYGRTVPLKVSGAAGTSAVGAKGTRKIEDKRVSQTAKGKRFEKRVEYQDPATFAGPDVSTCVQ